MILNDENYKEIIDADHVEFGKNVKIGKNVQIKNIDGSVAKSVSIGDNVFIGDNCLILVPEFKIGDYSTIHRNCRISGYKPCEIGHNFWIDQSCIMNSTDNLFVGSNVGIGAYSQLWTHIKHGDILEGCRFNTTKPMMIENDVWFVGHCIVSPIHAKSKSMAMIGSVITKDMESNHIYAGCPAKDITEKIGNQFITRTYVDKLRMFNVRLMSFLQEKDKNSAIQEIQPVEKLPDYIEESCIYFDLNRRLYTKTRTDFEIEFMKFILPEFKFTGLSGFPNGF